MVQNRGLAPDGWSNQPERASVRFLWTVSFTAIQNRLLASRLVELAARAARCPIGTAFPRPIPDLAARTVAAARTNTLSRSVHRNSAGSAAAPWRSGAARANRAA